MAQDLKEEDHAAPGLVSKNASTVVNDEEKAVSTTRTSRNSAVWDYLMTEVDTKQCTAPLSAFCFMTGFM